MKAQMPVIDVGGIGLEGEDLEIARLVINPSTGRLWSSRPDLTDDVHRKSAYVWRMLAFTVSPNSQHHCMPVGADLYLPCERLDWDAPDSREKRARQHEELTRMREHLDKLVDKLEDTVPPSQRYGLLRWLPLVGTRK